MAAFRNPSAVKFSWRWGITWQISEIHLKLKFSKVLCNPPGRIMETHRESWEPVNRPTSTIVDIWWPLRVFLGTFDNIFVPPYVQCEDMSADLWTDVWWCTNWLFGLNESWTYAVIKSLRRTHTRTHAKVDGWIDSSEIVNSNRPEFDFCVAGNCLLSARKVPDANIAHFAKFVKNSNV